MELCYRPLIFADLPHIVAGFSTRPGGVSPPPFASLNLGLHTGDHPESVQENQRRLFESVNLPVNRLVIPVQVHGMRIVTVTQPDTRTLQCDGLVTATPDLVLTIRAADCAAILLADPEAGVIGACHAGWRGAVQHIAEHTLLTMSQLGARPDRMRAYISPCISVRHFEVGPEVADQFPPTVVKTKPHWPRPHVDLKAYLTNQLHTAGIPIHSIECDPACTYERTNLYFSYRAEAGKTGRMMGFICLRGSIIPK
jgi:hypothetical protein